MYSDSIETLQIFNPLDLLEEIVTANDWIFERCGDDEMIVEVTALECNYHLHFFWQAERNAMQCACQFDLLVDECYQRTINDLLARINQQLWLGHFDVSSFDKSLMFRHTMLVNGFLGASTDQLKDLVQIAMIECERCYPAFQLVLEHGKSVEEAFTVTLDVVGEA